MENIIYKNGTLTGKEYKSGMTFSFRLAIPNVSCEKYALLLEHDGLNEQNVESIKKLADEGAAPYSVCIGVSPAKLTLPSGETRKMRRDSYDLFNSEYGDFIVFELIPYIEKEFGIPLFDDPDMRCVSGGSSGGISAFTIAWFHPDYFHRVYMSSPSFLSMGRGNEIPYLIRKCETKPLKIYEEYSENEPNDYFGASLPVDIEARMALEFAGYDFAYEYFAGEGHCSRYRNYENAYKRNKWLWADYKTKKVEAPRNSPRIDRIIDNDSVWVKADNFPSKEIPKSELVKTYSTVVASADGQLYYASNLNDDIVYAFIAHKQAEAYKPAVHAMLHTIPGILPKGAIDMATDNTDRLYVLTRIGIQCVRSFGLIDAILDIPEGIPLEIAITDALYVKTSVGIYKRALRPECIGKKERKCVSYYD